MALKRTIQTLVYLPHFLSWVTLSGILIDILAQTGIVNQFLVSVFGIKPIFFLGMAAGSDSQLLRVMSGKSLDSTQSSSSRHCLALTLHFMKQLK